MSQEYKNPVEPLPTGFLECAESQNRTGDTRFFRPVLYRLSYLGMPRPSRFAVGLRLPRERLAHIWPTRASKASHPEASAWGSPAVFDGLQ
jgi:hypothetical protein